MKPLALLNRKPIARALHLKTWGKPLFEIMPVRSPGVDIAKFRLAYIPTIKKAIDEGRLDTIPGDNLQAIDDLLSMDKKVMLLTSREHAELKHMLEPDHDLANRVTAFYYRDNMDFHKPDPRAFQKLITDNDLKPSEAVYVGDSVSDAAAAKGAGLHFIASLESGLRTRQDFKKYPVDAFIEKFPQIVGVVKRLERPVIQ